VKLHATKEAFNNNERFVRWFFDGAVDVEKFQRLSEM
jgi:hypothetical protein